MKKSPALQLWGGIECTMNRVGDQYLDQIETSGHQERLEDLDLFASIGLKTLRYPVLWEKVSPAQGQFDWAWLDIRLNKIKDLGICPIAGLLHHGSGPKYTDLLDPKFPSLFAEYARAVANRYPWIDLYTPVNEPLTTARFSCLYGIWYPHQHSDKMFLTALIHQIQGIILAMREIRAINPSAKLIQTEDLGQVSSTPKLAYQADFENERRWLTFDLLFGRVRKDHPLWEYLKLHISVESLEWISANSLPPDTIGINHYVTSNRYLDEDFAKYPASTHGGNGKHRYADIETVRVPGETYVTIKNLLSDVGSRYNAPIAVTESHIDAGREDQLRWIKQTWESCKELQREGIDVRAVTLWSLLGSYDWNSLCKKSQGYYESGVFDIRSGRPRPTALAQLAKTIIKEDKLDHPILEQQGWWQRPIQNNHLKTKSRPIVITGGRGTLGFGFSKFCTSRDLEYISLSREDMDVANENTVQTVLNDLKPWAVINTAGYVKVDEAEKDAERCFRENVDGAVNIAQYCREKNIKLLSFSSDLVFDGKSNVPYIETSPTAPLNVYGKAKKQAEEEILNKYPDALVVRSSAFFGPWDSYNFVTKSIKQIKSGEIVKAADLVVSPTYIPDLIHWALNLLIDGEKGIWHLSNKGEVSWVDFARKVAAAAGLDEKKVEEQSIHELNLSAPRPKYSVLGTAKGQLLPTLEVALEKYFSELGPL